MIPQRPTTSAWPQIDPGKMIHRVWILHKVESDDISGVVVSYPVLYGPLWAEIQTISGREQIQSGQTTTQSIRLVKIYFQPGIFNNMRVQTDTGSTYYIQSIDNPDERNIVLILTCMGLDENQ